MLFFLRNVRTVVPFFVIRYQFPVSILRISLGGLSWEGIMQFLINNSVDVNIKDSKDQTHLLRIQERGKVLVAELLSKHGANE